MSQRLILVSGSFAPREGGAERQMRSVLAALAAEGYNCHVVTQRVAGAPRRQKVEGVSVHRVGSLRAFGINPRLGMVLFLVAAGIKALRLRPERIISLQLGAASAAAASVSRLLSIPHTVRLTGGGTAAYRSEAFSRRASRGGRLVVKWVMDRKLTILVAPARHLVSDFEECFPGMRARTAVLPNGVELVRDPNRRSECRSGVLWYARRGSEQSINFFLCIARHFPDVTFRVMGAELEGELPRNVDCLGWLDSPMEEMWKTHVLLNTSKYEGSPNTVLQALAAGCHVVGRDNAGMREIRDRYGEVVRLFTEDDLDSAAEAMRWALNRRPAQPAAVVSASEAQENWHALLTTGAI